MSNPFDDADLVACARIVETGDPERFAAAMAAPVAARARLFPLYALNVEVTRAPWLTEESVIAEMRLQWWHDVLEEIAQGAPARRHEVVTPLSQILTPAHAELLLPLVEARRWDIYRDAHDDDAALLTYLDDTAGRLMEVASRVLGDPDGRAARALGTAAGLASYLLAVPELEARNRIPLVDGRPEGVTGLAHKGLGMLSQARMSPRPPASARPALYPGWLAAPILKRAANTPALVAEGILMPPEGIKRWRRLWVSTTGRF